jgi:heme exporter protein CcmD
MNALAMGDYGAYVWSCIILTAAVLIICDWRARLRQRRVYRDIVVRIKALGDGQ